jgi:hypothetical protein
MQRLWIWPIQEKLDEKIVEDFKEKVKAALKDWRAHKVPVKSSISAYQSRFLIVEAGSEVSGCAIDWLSQNVRNAAQRLNIPLADNGEVFFKDKNGEIQNIRFSAIPDLLQKGELTPETIVFDLTVTHTGALQNFEVPLKETWMKRYLTS